MHADRSVLFNLSAAAIAEIGTKAAQFATVIVIARNLDPADFGIVGAAWALFQLALPLVQSAPELVGIRNLAADRLGALRWISVIGVMKMTLVLVAFVLLAIYAAVVYGPQSRSAAQVTMQAVVLVGIALTPAWAARSFQRTDFYVVPRVSQSVAFLALTAIFLAVDRQPLVVPVAEALSWFLGVVVAYHLLRRLLPDLSTKHIFGSVRRLKEIRTGIVNDFNAVLHYALAGVAATALWWSPVLIVETVVGREAGGYTAAAVRLVTTAIVGLQLGLQAFLPVLSKYHATDPGKFRDLVSSLTLYSALIHLVTGGLLFVFASPMMNLIFGARYLAAIPSVRILSAMLIIAGANTALTYGLIAADRYRRVLLFAVLGGVAVVGGQLIGVVALNTIDGLSWGVPFYFAQTVFLAIYAKKHQILGEDVITTKRFGFRSIRTFLLER